MTHQQAVALEVHGQVIRTTADHPFYADAG